MPFIANTEEQRQEMLATIGLSSVDELFQAIPRELRCQEPQLPDGLGFHILVFLREARIPIASGH